MKDFTHLDTAILLWIASGYINSFHRLQDDQELMAHANTLAGRDRWGPKGWRLLDRRLQALRTAGAIEFRRDGWSLAC